MEHELQQIVIEFAGKFVTFTSAFDFPQPPLSRVARLIRHYLQSSFRSGDKIDEMTAQEFAEYARACYPTFPDRRGWQLVTEPDIAASIPNFGYTTNYFECAMFLQVFETGIHCYSSAREWDTCKPNLIITKELERT